MKVFQNAGQIHAEINFLRSQGKKIGLVPTMGALHKGHISLIESALTACDIVVCSIFVNPLQFNNPEDFKKYPSTLTNDIKLLEEIDCHLLFNPGYDQVYGQSQPREFDLGHLNDVMEGRYRPGHFQGVANVVLRLFEIIQPDMAFFGLKDYQQFLVIKKITQQYLPEIEILGIETIRDENGLAMSSRNLRLSPEQYQHAVKVATMLKKVGTKLKTKSIPEVKAWFQKEVNKLPEMSLEYLEFADTTTLEPIQEANTQHKFRAFTAFYAGEVRLIDNVSI